MSSARKVNGQCYLFNGKLYDTYPEVEAAQKNADTPKRSTSKRFHCRQHAIDFMNGVPLRTCCENPKFYPVRDKVRNISFLYFADWVNMERKPLKGVDIDTYSWRCFTTKEEAVDFLRKWGDVPTTVIDHNGNPVETLPQERPGKQKPT
jgi:hypothetical protein